MELYFQGLTAAFGLCFPIDFVFGAHVTRDLLLTVGLSLPMTLLFNPFAFLFPIQPGVGVEYRLDRKLSLTFDTRLGPTFATVGVGATGDLSFRALFGAGYRF